MKLSVADSFELTNHSIMVQFVNGKASIVDGGESDTELKIDISDFSALIMGAVSFETLYQFGLAEVSNLESIPVIQRLFLTAQKPVCLSGF